MNMDVEFRDDSGSQVNGECEGLTVGAELGRRWTVWLPLVAEPEADVSSVSRVNAVAPSITRANGKPSSVASCLCGSLGLVQVVELTATGNVRCLSEEADEERFAQRQSPRTAQFGFCWFSRA